MTNLNRRDFLKLAGAAAATSVLKPLPPDDTRLQPIGLGRVTDWRTWVYKDPRPGAQREIALARDEVVSILDTVSTEGIWPHNPVWNLTKYGWVYSSWLQPVERQLNPVEERIPAQGFWAEVTVPYVEMRVAPTDRATSWYRLYYSSVHLVVGRVDDASNGSWYQLKDDQYTGRIEYVPADALRKIMPAEMAPISPNVTDKHIEVSIKDQNLYAYENNSLVFTARCATGATFSIEGGTADFTTPTGEHTVVRKRPSRHMMGFIGRPDQYDLPGVPFCTYFTQEGAAVHGAYWHNDFGHPRSHGCVNVLAADARWVYRWSQPVAPYEDAVLVVNEGGTKIVVA